MNRWPAAALSILLVPGASPAWAELFSHLPTAREEVARAVVESGHCEVPVCSDIDFGDFTFRYYSRGRASAIRSVPPGVCACQSVISGDRDFNGSIGFSVETPDGARITNVHVARNYLPPHPRAKRPIAPVVTTPEMFARDQGKLVEVPNFTRYGEPFAGFRVFSERKSAKSTLTRYYFMPKQPLSVHGFGRDHALAFETPLGWPGPGGKWDRSSAVVAATIRISPLTYLYEFFYLPRQKPADWAATMQKVLSVVEQHIVWK